MTTWLDLQTNVLKYSAGKLVCSFGSYKGKLILLGFSSGKEVILPGILFLCICPASLQGFWGIACRYVDLRRCMWVGSPPARKRVARGCKRPLCSQHSLWCKAALSATSPQPAFPICCAVPHRVWWHKVPAQTVSRDACAFCVPVLHGHDRQCNIYSQISRWMIIKSAIFEDIAVDYAFDRRF